MATPAQDVPLTTATVPPASAPVAPIVQRGSYRFPPGLRSNLLLNSGRGFFDRNNPILLFEYLTAKYGRAAHYRILTHDVVLLNDPVDVRERLQRITQSLSCNEPQLRQIVLLELWLRHNQGVSLPSETKMAFVANY